MGHDCATTRRYTPKKTINKHIGQQMRQARKAAGLRMEDLGQAVGLDFRLIQKYESAGVQVAAATLWKIAEALHKPVDYFFEGMT